MPYIYYIQLTTYYYYLPYLRGGQIPSAEATSVIIIATDCKAGF